MKKKSSALPSFADKVLKVLKRAQTQKLVDLSAFREGKAIAEKHEEEVADRIGQLESQPAFALYALAQNQLSLLVEILCQLRELSKFTNTILDAEEEYMPTGPPMSPITISQFTSWSTFDLAFGSRRENLADIAKKVGLWTGLHASYGELFEKFSQSRMGLYRHEGQEAADRVKLCDVVTGESHSCVVPAGELGAKGHLWFTRILPPPDKQWSSSVVFGTPYKLIHTPEKEWLHYLERNLAKTKRKSDAEAAEFLLKYGLAPCYWLEYLHDAYFNHTSGLILIKGVPDILESLPHGDPSSMKKHGLISKV